jgi:hypothetical protein
MNIQECYRKGQLVGYKVKRRVKGKQCGKYFTSTENTVAKNKELAEQWLKDLKDGKIVKNDYNKSQDIPKDISVIREKGVVIGYRVMMWRNGVCMSKSFQSKIEDLQILLEKAKKYLDEVNIGNIHAEVEENRFKIDKNLPKGIGVIRDENKNIIGYRVKIIRNGKMSYRGFQDSSGTKNKELLENAKKYLKN